MRIRSFLLGALCTLGLGAMMVSCGDNDNEWDDGDSKVELPDSRVCVYILNEGSIDSNNAGIAFYDPQNGDFIDDIFYRQNESRLGDTGQSMIRYNGSIYVSVYGSNYIAKLNAACVQEKRTLFSSDPDLRGGVRYIAAEDGYIYASFYGGIVAKIDAATLEVKAKLNGLGANLEGVVICDDNLYVANSYEIVFNPATNKNDYVYKKEVKVIDLKTFSLKETLTVAQNPNKLVEEDDNVFLISWDYFDESYVLQFIEPKNNNKVSKLGYATDMAAGDDVIYLVDSRTDWSTRISTNTFSYYDIKAGKLVGSSFLKDAPAELINKSISMMSVNPENGDIYIGTTLFADGNGTMYRFRKDGTFVEKFDCGGQNPKAAVFFN
jgi:DNA-binding beta-propeller fold protein YncE